MKTKWWIAAGLIVVAVIGVTVAIPALLPPKPGVTMENFDRIEKGMTREQVEAILGKPPDEPSHGIRFRHAPSWTSDAGDVIWIQFDDNNRVIQKGQSLFHEPTLNEKIRDWFRPRAKPEAA